MLGKISGKNERLLDLSWREIAVFAPLIAWAFWIGLRPRQLLDVIERPVAQIVERVQRAEELTVCDVCASPRCKYIM